MTLKEARSDYYGLTGKLSDVVRQLSFAGIGVFWILRIGENVGSFKFDPAMIRGLSAFCLALMFDILHYVVASAVWGIYSYYREKTGAKPDQELDAPDYLNIPAIAFFWLKTACCVIGLWILLRYLGMQF